MRTMWGILAVAAVCGGTLVATDGAAAATPTGDTCVANGSGTSYTLTITVGQSSPAQYGYAVGAHGAKVTKLEGANGTSSAASLPPNTTAAVIGGGPSGVPGANVALSVKTSAPVSGAFVVVPWDETNRVWFNAVNCPVSKLINVPSSTFSLENHFVYLSSSHAWSFFVTLPGPGKVNVAQDGGTKTLIANTRYAVGHSGKAKLMVHTTAAGRTALTTSESLKVKLSIEFEPTNGKPGVKTLTVTLRK